ncbi:MAG: CHAP domain-containing protein [Oscillospiraceae bacterium]|nr:CHAP domain-containing protein [Oscillospiraceae bacterium]
MSKIKTKTTIKDIKVLDKAASGTAHVKNAFIRSKESVESTQDTGYHSPSEYASNNISGKAQGAVEEAVHHFGNPHKNAAENINKAKERFRESKQNLPKQRKRAAEQAQKASENAKKTTNTLKGKADQTQKSGVQAKKAVTDAKRTLQQTRQAGRKSIKTLKQSGKGAKATGKGTIKTVKKSIKTTERTAKAAVKTAQHTAKVTGQSAKTAAKSAKLAAQASKAAAKAAVTTAKAAVKATAALVKATIAAVKGLVALIAAGGWIAVLVIIIICLIGLLVGSVFGVFFSGEDSRSVDGRTMTAVISELNTQIYDEIEKIKSDNAHDVLEMDPVSIHWPEILSIYAIKINTDSENPMEVVTLDDNKIEKLQSIYDEMILLSHSIKTETQEQTVEDEDGNETTETIVVTTLQITLSQKGVYEMAAEHHFSNTQVAQLQELLSPEYSDMWASIVQ